jgi:uncharacterized membrane protein
MPGAWCPMPDARSPYPSPVPRTTSSFWTNFRRFFFRGVAILLPSVLTIWIVVQLYLFVDAQVARPINAGIRTAVLQVVSALPDAAQPEWFTVSDRELNDFRTALAQQGTIEARTLAKASDAQLLAEIRRNDLARLWEARWYLRLVGLVVAILLFYFAGLLLGGIFGRAIYEHVERFLTRLPVVKQVYPHVKQLVDLLLGEKKMAFRRVVLVQYPSKDVWSVAFVTSGGLAAAAEALHADILTVFVPSTPTPFTGFTVTVKKADAIDLPISVDEALRFVLTGGVLVPDKQARPGVLPHGGDDHRTPSASPQPPHPTQGV